MNTTTFSVPSITCHVCSDKINNALRQVKGVENVNVDLKTKEVTVNFQEQQTNPGQIIRTVADLGYETIQ